MASYDDSDGVWRTIGGRRIFIKDGESLSSAMKRSGKFKSAKGKKLEEDAKVLEKMSEKNRQKEKELLDKYNEIPQEERIDAFVEGKNWKDLVKEKDTRSQKEEGLASKRSKQYSDIEKASGLKVEKSYQTDKYGNGDADRFELSDGRIVEHSRESLGAKEDKWSIETFKDGSLDSQEFKSYDDMINHLKGGSDSLSKGDSYINKQGTRVDILDKDDKGQTLHKFTDTNGKTDYKNYNEKDVSAMLKHNGYEKQSSDKYSDYYKKENLGTPSNYQKGDNIEFKNDYGESIKGTVVREATDKEKEFQMNNKLKGYIVETKNGNKFVVSDTKIKNETGNVAYKKAFEEYKKKHPNTKLTLNKFIDMSEGK